MHKTIKYTAYATIGFALLLSLTVIFWLVFPYQTLVVSMQPTPVKSKVVLAGDDIELVGSYCNYSARPRHLVRELVGDSSRVTLSDTYIETTPTGCESTATSISIPKTTATGIYHIEFTDTVEVNPLREVTEHFVSEDFTVVE